MVRFGPAAYPEQVSQSVCITHRTSDTGFATFVQPAVKDRPKQHAGTAHGRTMWLFHLNGTCVRKAVIGTNPKTRYSITRDTYCPYSMCHFAERAWWPPCDLSLGRPQHNQMLLQICSTFLGECARVSLRMLSSLAILSLVYDDKPYNVHRPKWLFTDPLEKKAEKRPILHCIIYCCPSDAWNTQCSKHVRRVKHPAHTRRPVTGR